MSIQLFNLGFSYGEQNIFTGVNLSLQQGEILSVLGPNGAGKTTLLNVMVGLLAPAEGKILYEGHPYESFDNRSLSKLVGYVPQIITPAFDFSVLDYVVTGCAPHIGAFSKPKEEHFDIAMGAIEQLGISHLANKSYMQISGGERQQVSIARVIAQRPKFIFMDEPTAHLDYGNQIQVLKIIKQLSDDGFGVIFTTHNPDHVLLLDGNVAILDRQGMLHTGDNASLINNEFLSALYGTELKISSPDGLERCVCYSPGLSKTEVSQ